MQNDQLPDDARDVPSQSPRGDDCEPPRKVRMITAKDAGWITPTAFVAPITLVPIDPPRPLNRRRQQ